ncbi:MAG: DNA translocase FtsK [Chloroflexota bacterium]|nr:DNA translocase FtsK [Chloroflexota bacterium]
MLNAQGDQGWQFTIFGIPIPFIGKREARSARKLHFFLTLATLISVAGIVAVATWLEQIQSIGESMWESFQYTLIAIVALPIMSGLALWSRAALISHKPHIFLAGFILLPVIAGSLQLFEPHFGGTFGEQVIGPTAVGGILRISAIFILALIVSAPGATIRLIRKTNDVSQRLGVSIGLHSTNSSQKLGSGIRLLILGILLVTRKTWGLTKKVLSQYRRYPIHIILTAWTVRFIGQRLSHRRSPSGIYLDPELDSTYQSSDAGDIATEQPYGDHEVMMPPGTAHNLPPWLHNQDSGDNSEPEALPSHETAPEENDNRHMTVEAVPPESDTDDLDSDPYMLEIQKMGNLDDGPSEAESLPEVIDLSGKEARRSGAISSSKSTWSIPSLELLKTVKHREVSEVEHQAIGRLIEQTLSEYGIEVAIKEIRPGPVVTQYGLVPGWVRRYREIKERNADGSQARDEDGRLISSRVEDKTRVKVDHILAREKDLALALAAPSLRFEAPVPGESFVGLEVPNARREVVTLRSILESSAFLVLQKKAKLPVALGQGSGGESVITDLADMPHLLIAGATGSGKSVCINTIICSLMMQLTPLELQMYLVDPKRVELTAYNGSPHLAGPVLVEADQAVPALHALIVEMQSRYKRFEEKGARNIQGYNAKISKQEDRIPYLMLVIDELADLMMTSPTEVEYALCRLAQLGRATGIHLVVATQRPSVDVLTGLIKANFPSRASFAVSSQVDSRTVLDGAGAEKLLGRGDMLFMPTNAAKPKRVQGTYISDDEVDSIVTFWKKQRGKGQPLPTVEVDLTPADAENVNDILFQNAQSLAIKHNRISASLLQRKLGIGYAKAASLLDHLEDKGIVGSGDPGKSRNVIISG